MTLILKRIRTRRTRICPTCQRPILRGQRAFWSADLSGLIRCWTCAERLIAERGMQAYDGGLYVTPSKNKCKGGITT